MNTDFKECWDINLITRDVISRPIKEYLILIANRPMLNRLHRKYKTTRNRSYFTIKNK